jgi:hypothetical protein
MGLEKPGASRWLQPIVLSLACSRELDSTSAALVQVRNPPRITVIVDDHP